MQERRTKSNGLKEGALRSVSEAVFFSYMMGMGMYLGRALFNSLLQKSSWRLAGLLSVFSLYIHLHHRCDSRDIPLIFGHSDLHTNTRFRRTHVSISQHTNWSSSKPRSGIISLQQFMEPSLCRLYHRDYRLTEHQTRLDFKDNIPSLCRTLSAHSSIPRTSESACRTLIMEPTGLQMSLLFVCLHQTCSSMEGLPRWYRAYDLVKTAAPKKVNTHRTIETLTKLEVTNLLGRWFQEDAETRNLVASISCRQLFHLATSSA